jgi:hypothetical protein
MLSRYDLVLVAFPLHGWACGQASAGLGDHHQ